MLLQTLEGLSDRDSRLADTGHLVTELFASLLAEEWQTGPSRRAPGRDRLKNPEEADQALVAIFGAKGATGAWHDHFRVWRKKRLRQVERQYGDRLDEVAVLADFAAKIKALGRKRYLESMTYSDGG
jgi:hypothetical protein